MGGHHYKRYGMRNYLAFLFFIVLMLQTEDAAMLLSYVSANLLVLFFHILGIEIDFINSNFILGQLSIPWTQDCTGLNTLVVLLGIWLWKGYQAGKPLYNLILALTVVSLSILINIFRAMAIIAYRHIYYPNIESPEVHFLFGLVLLVPCIYVLFFRTHKPGFNDWLSILYFTILFSLLAPVYYAPGGNMVVATSIFCLYINFKYRSEHVTASYVCFWLIVALLIVITQMESLWLPWLLVWPLQRTILPKRLVPFYLIILSGTIQPLAMQGSWQIVIIAAALPFLIFLICTHLSDAVRAMPATKLKTILS